LHNSFPKLHKLVITTRCPTEYGSATLSSIINSPGLASLSDVEANITLPHESTGALDTSFFDSCNGCVRWPLAVAVELVGIADINFLLFRLLVKTCAERDIKLTLKTDEQYVLVEFHVVEED
jgi:hypothetical protein